MPARPITALRCLLAGVLAAALVLAGAPSALAHTVLLAADPAPDTAVADAPARVSATFNEDLQTTFAAITVVGPDAVLWSVGEPEVRGPVVSVAVRPGGPAGRYTVNYRVTSADGHPVTGSWSYTVNAGGKAATTAVKPPAPVHGAARIPLWPFAIGAIALVAVVAAWALRRRS